MKMRWFPWKFLLKRTARAYNVTDPVELLARLRRFAQPSEVQEPLELLRAGILFHARGLINTRAIQYNLDWNWPYWVVRQFDPNDSSFIPRGFSFSHVNLTHRNWTALGQPDCPIYPVVDPRGLITPLHNGWSVDFWLITENGEKLFPSRLQDAGQRLEMNDGLQVKSVFNKANFHLQTIAYMKHSKTVPECICHVTGNSPEPGWIVVALRPFNPEGVQFIDRIAWRSNDRAFRVNQLTDIFVNKVPSKILFSNYEAGDVANRYSEIQNEASIECPNGMATAAAFFSLKPDQPREISVSISLTKEHTVVSTDQKQIPEKWETVLSQSAQLNIPNEKIQFLFDSAVRTLILLTAVDVFPGPYTYRRFWFRDATFMIQALLALGLAKRVRSILDAFPQRQKRSGYFQSQEGEWDSNGQVLWIAERFQEVTGQSFPHPFLRSVYKGAEWIQNKRNFQKKDGLHQGLLPAGFSAEHLGPNDYYFWDNFWSVAGLQAAAQIAGRSQQEKKQLQFERNALDLKKCIFETVSKIPEQKRQGAIPASPYRRMDAGAIGSMVADYPLQITAPGDPMILQTAEFLIGHCFHSGAFFQDMIHSGINAYLTLAIAQTLLRASDRRYQNMIEKVADLASPTGQWPEAIHPFTGGGCMGDGQHGWAAAEWIMIIRNLFIREEKNRILIGSGIFKKWLKRNNKLLFGPTLTAAGKISVIFRLTDGKIAVQIKTDARNTSIPLEIKVPGFAPKKVPNEKGEYILKAL